MGTLGDVRSSGDIMIHTGDTMSTSGGCSVHQGFQYKLKGFYHLDLPDV